MHTKSLWPVITCFILSFLINLLSHHPLLISITNSSSLGLSVYLFTKNLNLKLTLFVSLIIISFGLMPLFHFSPTYEVISLLNLFLLFLLYLYINLHKKYLILTIWGMLLLFGNIYSGEIIKYPFNIQYSQLIFNSPEINFHINRHQQDALFIPYKIRLVVYSKLIYVYALLTNLFNFLNLKSLSDILLIANLYPLFIGIYKALKQKNKLRDIFIVGFLITALIAGVDRSTDKFQSLYLLGPIFIYLILLGLQSVNKKIYLSLWVLSLFILISPKI